MPALCLIFLLSATYAIDADDALDGKSDERDVDYTICAARHARVIRAALRGDVVVTR